MARAFIFSIWVVRTLDELERHDGAEISEEAIESWPMPFMMILRFAIPGKKAYTEQFQLAEYLLRTLRRLESDQQLEQKFEELFDGVEVLPSPI